MKRLILLFLALTPLYAQKVGLPVSTVKNSYVIENSAYSVGYAENFGIPVWEMHELTPMMLHGEANVPVEWKLDSRVRGFRLSAKDIENEKTPCVQLFPSTHAKNDVKIQESSYYSSNLVFMNKQLYESLWKRATASFEEKAKEVGKVYLYSGPIFDRDFLKAKHIVNNKVVVPVAYYRVILYFENEKPVYKCYRFANKIPSDYERNCPLENFEINIYELEADTDVDFFDRDIDANFRQDKMKFLENRVR